MIEPPPAAFIAQLDAWSGEKLVFQVHRHAVVPVFGRDRVELVTLVVRGIVDQHRDRPMLVRSLARMARRNASTSRRSHRMNRPRIVGRRDVRDPALAQLDGDVDEGDLPNPAP